MNQLLGNHNIRIIRNDTGYGFTLSRYTIFNEQDETKISFDFKNDSKKKQSVLFNEDKSQNDRKLSINSTSNQSSFLNNKVSNKELLLFRTMNFDDDWTFFRNMYNTQVQVF